MNDLKQYPSSRSEALGLGIAKYFTGIPCANGHMEVRNAKSGHCMECDRKRQAFRLANDSSYRNLHRKQTLAYKLRVLSDPVRRRQIREREKELQNASAARKAKKSTADQIRNQRDEVKSRRRELQKVAYQEKYANDADHIAARKLRGAEWARKNKDRCNAKTNARRAARQNAQPPWLTADQRAQIEGFYNTASRRSDEDGIPYEVDHIVPLKNSVVCGLHVPWNLQVITAFENRSKGNKLVEV